MIKKLPITKKFTDVSGNICKEQVYAVLADQEVEHLNIENIEYKWLKKEEFVKTIRWYGQKKEIETLLDEIASMNKNKHS